MALHVLPAAGYDRHTYTGRCRCHPVWLLVKFGQGYRRGWVHRPIGAPR